METRERVGRVFITGEHKFSLLSLREQLMSDLTLPTPPQAALDPSKGVPRALLRLDCTLDVVFKYLFEDAELSPDPRPHLLPHPSPDQRAPQAHRRVASAALI